jgi:hypothetical protein
LSKISFKAIPKKFNNGSYLLLPATKADKAVLDQFCENVNNRYVTVTANYARGNKSYDQVKTVFALIKIRFQLQYHRCPTDTEQAMVYSSFLWKYADKVPNPLNPEEMVPISLSQMSKSQAASFIGSIIADIYEYAGNTLTDTQQIELKEIFEEFQTENSFGKGNYFDYDKEGNMLSEEEWRKRNHFSFASGVDIEGLQLHHILGRNAHLKYKDCSWNWIMLTEEEHMEIIHAKGGWKKFILLFPHTAKRIKNAYDTAHEMYPREIQEAFIELGLINEMSEEITDKTKDSVENLQKEEVQELSFDNTVVKENLTVDDLAEQALSSQEDDIEKYNIF